MQVEHERQRVYAALLLCGIVLGWGANWPVMKIGLEALPPFSYAFLRIVLGAVMLSLVAAARGEFQLPRRQDFPVVLSVGVLQLGIFLALINLAVPAVGAGRSAVLAYTTPLWVTPLSAIFLCERFGRRQVVGVAAGLAGLVAILHPTAAVWTAPESRRGVILLLLAALAWAGAIVHVRGHRWHGSTLSLMPWQLAVAAFVTLPFAAGYEDMAAIH